MARVSILVPVYNSAPYLAEALNSIGDQRFGDFELIAIDDGSSDGSLGLLRAFAAGEPRMRLITRPNRGIVATRNQLLDEATGEFIAWMDSDDISHPERLARQVAMFDADPRLVCIGTNVRQIDPAGRNLWLESYPADDAQIRAEQMRGAGLRFAATMQRRAVASAVGGFRAPFPMGEDFDFLLRVGERGPMANVSECLYFYRQHAMSTCTAYGADWGAYRELILSLARERRQTGSDRLQRGEAVALPHPRSDGSHNYLPAVLLRWAAAAIDQGDRRRALGYTVEAIRSAPLKRAGWRALAKLVLFAA